MALSRLPICYCANVHPGESVAAVRASLDRYAAPLARRARHPVAVGLWLSGSAAAELADDPSMIDGLRSWLAAQGLACYTMNAFPLGNFHARRVKEAVYQPDWTTPARRDYTNQVAEILARLLPDDPSIDGSISTLPCGFAPLHPAGAGWSIHFPELIAVAGRLADIEHRTGRTLRLAIEPEPFCLLQTTDQAIQFFHDLWRSVEGRPEEAAVRRHLGVCFDVCHQAVEFEDLADSIRRLDHEGIRINKVHVTCALELADPLDPAAREHLSRFVEERYLHQTFGRHPDGRVLSLVDLTTPHCLDPPPEWLACSAWRVHFHVPVHEESIGPLRTTRPLLAAALAAIEPLDYAPHLEVETYTWSVLPRDHQADSEFDLVAGLLAELEATQRTVQELQRHSR